MIKCSSCGRENSDSFSFCLDCGNELKDKLKPLPTTQFATISAANADQQPAVEPILLTQKKGTPQPPVELPPPPPVAPPIQQAPPQPPPPVAPPVLTASPETGPVFSPEDFMKPKASPPSPVHPTSEQQISSTEAPGQPEVPEVRMCRNCGGELPIGFLFCGKCGAKYSEGGVPTPDGPARTQFMHIATAAVTKRPRGRLVTINPDGSEGFIYNLQTSEISLGRQKGDIIIEEDMYISPLHATFIFKDDKLILRDENSTNGVFVRIKGPVELKDGDLFRLGRQLIVFSCQLETVKLQSQDDDAAVSGSPNLGYWGVLTTIVETGILGSRYLLKKDDNYLGRDFGDVLFNEDGFVSSKHALLRKSEEMSFFLEDLGSSNGTFIKINKEEVIGNNDLVLIGEQLFRLEIR